MSSPLPVDPNTAAFVGRARRALPVLAAAGVTGGLAGLPNVDGLRQAAADLRQHAVDHLDRYVRQASDRVRAAGGTVAEAVDPADARRRVTAWSGGEPAVLRSWSPVADEVGLVPGLDGAGARPVVAASFVVAETGQAVLLADEPGTAAASGALYLAGVDAVVPRAVDLAVLLKLLARSAVGRPMPPVVSLVTPAHLLWVDNGRRAAAGGPYREALRCIGCGACAAVCPVYQPAWVSRASGGPIGAILGPTRGQPVDPHLPFASTLCGACGDACPVKIDLPGLLIRRRADAVAAGAPAGPARWWAWAAGVPWRFRVAQWWYRRTLAHPRRPVVTPDGPPFHARWSARGPARH